MDLAAEERIVFGDLVADRTQPFAHAPMRDHAAGDAGGALQIVFRAGRRLLIDQLLGGATSQHHHQVIAQFVLGHAQAIFRRARCGCTPSDRPRGMIVTLCTRCAPGDFQADSVCPAS